MALSGAGYSGDPLWVNGLIKYMDDPELARRAGEAFSMITGADLAYLDLDRDWPEEVATGPSESATDDNVTLDPDESTPWPDSEKIAVWWQQQQRHFTQGQSYLDGKSISVQSCQQVLRTAFQRQRRQAALRLAMLGQPFFAVDSPAKRQMASLHQMLND